MAPTPAPPGLGDAGRALWDSISDPVDAWSLNAAERAILARACRVADRLEALDAQLDAVLAIEAALANGTAEPDGPQRSGLISRGSMGQDVEAPVLVSLAKHDALLQRLLSSLKLPDLATGATPASTSARTAANARWQKPRSA